MAEACSVLWRSQDMVVGVTERGRWCGEARERIEEGRNVAVVLASTAARRDRSYAYNDDGHHPALAFFIAVLALVSSCTTAAALITCSLW